MPGSSKCLSSGYWPRAKLTMCSAQLTSLSKIRSVKPKRLTVQRIKSGREKWLISYAGEWKHRRLSKIKLKKSMMMRMIAMKTKTASAAEFSQKIVTKISANENLN